MLNDEQLMSNLAELAELGSFDDWNVDGILLMDLAGRGAAMARWTDRPQGDDK
jgi:hypothetical protein